MASKKYTMMLGLLGLISTAAFAQDSTGVITAPTAASISTGTPADDSWIYAGTQYVRKGKENQQNAFLNGTGVYPAKPRNMMELGIGIGPSFMFSPIDSKLGYTAGLSLRKALGHIFSVRLGYEYSINYGQDYRLSDIGGPLNYGGLKSISPASTPSFYYAQRAYTGLTTYLPNYKSNAHQGSLDLIASLNTLSHYRGDPKVSYYVFAGYSFFADKTSSNLLDANGNAYDWSGVDWSASRSDIKKQVNAILNANQSNSLFKSANANVDPTNNPSVFKNKYETSMTDIRYGDRDQKASGGAKWDTKHALDLGAGIAFKITKHFNIGLEEKVNYIFDNGSFSGDIIQPEQRNSIMYTTNLKLNFNLGRSAKRIQPLWWVNPNNYIYNKLAVPFVLKDSDGDGVPDQFDLEPNTPAGCAVDTHGRSLDTDGDGVPDCRDKQKITPPNWFPVDADGVGTEPEPACCKELRDRPQVVTPPPATCAINSLPSVTFKKGARLDATAKATLDGAAAQLASNPVCKVKLVGYGASNKRDQQLSWDRVNAVKTYLVQKAGISEGRIIFTYGQDGNANTVDLQPTMEEGPSTVPAPNPQLSTTK
jgi:outer membrane protein OmpA-like peptidoglycan-associated protein